MASEIFGRRDGFQTRLSPTASSVTLPNLGDSRGRHSRRNSVPIPQRIYSQPTRAPLRPPSPAGISIRANRFNSLRLTAGRGIGKILYRLMHRRKTPSYSYTTAPPSETSSSQSMTRVSPGGSHHTPPDRPSSSGPTARVPPTKLPSAAPSSATSLSHLSSFYPTPQDFKGDSSLPPPPATSLGGSAGYQPTAAAPTRRSTPAQSSAAPRELTGGSSTTGWKCPFDPCTKTYDNRYDVGQIKSHILTHLINEKRVPPFKCDMCKDEPCNSFAREGSLRLHSLREHDVDKSSDELHRAWYEELTIQCPLCKKDKVISNDYELTDLVDHIHAKGRRDEAFLGGRWLSTA